MQNTGFSKEQYQNIYPEGIENHYWNYARNMIIYNQLKKYKLQDNKILEIGCGKGIVVNYLRKKEIDCFGVELADINIEKNLIPFIKTNTDVKILAQEEKDSYQVIMLLDVIEHIANPENFINELKTDFPNAKNFIISVPACIELWSNYDEYNGHFRRYDKKILESTLLASGFEILKTNYLFHLLYLPARIIVKLKKQRTVTLKAPVGFAKIIHKCLSLYFFIESSLFFNKLKGTSLLTIARHV